MASVTQLETLEYEERSGVGIWRITDFASHITAEEELEVGEAHFHEVASKDQMRAAVVEIENAADLGTEMQDALDRIKEEWSSGADEVDLQRLAYVADGMMARTVKMSVDADVETESFDAVDDAVDWCHDA